MFSGSYICHKSASNENGDKGLGSALSLDTGFSYYQSAVPEDHVESNLTDSVPQFQVDYVLLPCQIYDHGKLNSP